MSGPVPETSTCPDCGAELPPDAPKGLCPRCLYRLGFGLEPEDGTGDRGQRPEVREPGATEGVGEIANPRSPVGGQFGDYELLEEIGHGGMGIVYRARQKSLNRIVALKLLLFGPHAPPESVKRFRTEAVATAALHHPHIVAIHEVGFCEGQHFIAMEHIEGQPLSSLIRGIPLPALRAAGYLKSIAEAIHHAHERGILHRDLKPANILIDTCDQPRVTDFGLAKRLLEEGAGCESQTEMDLTLTGQVMGSPHYMPPEQARGRSGPPNRRSDIYALGAMLYHALTGRPPFAGDSPVETVQQVLAFEPVRPRLLNPGMPVDLETICLKCLEKEPAKRYATAQLLAEELARFLEGKPVLARPVRRMARAWRWGRRNPALAGLIAGWVAALALGVGGILWELKRVERHARHAEYNAYAADMKAAQIELQRENSSLALKLLRQYLPQGGKEDLRTVEWRYLWQQCRSDELLSLAHPEPVSDVALSPDGQLLATCTWGVDWKTRVWDLRSARVIKEFTGGGTPAPKRSLTFSPDGKWLVLRGPKGFEIRATSDWTLLREFDDVLPNSPCGLSANGRVLVACGESGLQAWDLLNGTCRLLTNTFAANFNLGISANGSRIVCSAAVPHFHNYGPTLFWDIEKDASSTLPTDPDVTSLAISPDGAFAASGHYIGDVILWDLATQESLALEVDRLGRAHRVSVLCVAFSPNGELLAAAGYDQIIRIWDTASRRLLRTLRWHGDNVWGLSFSSDGQRLVSASTDGTARIWDLQATQSAAFATRAFTLPTNTVLAGFLPGASNVVSMDQEARVAQLWGLPSGDLISSNAFDHPEFRGCQWRRVFPKLDRALGITTNGVVHLWQFTTGKHEKTIDLGATNFIPDHLSPDGRWLVGNPQGQASLTLYDLRAARCVQDFAFRWLWVYAAAFSPDSRWLVISHQRSGTAGAITAWDLHHGRAAKTFGASEMQIVCLAFSASGQILASGGADRDVRLWSFPAGTPFQAPLEGHLAYVAQIAFSADDKTLASVGNDGMRLWNVASGRETLVFENNLMASGDLRSIASSFRAAQAEFNPGGRSLIWQEFNGRIHVTPLPTLEEIDRKEIPSAGR
jgi:eukaryotic-like serine/threonine-protein kinase